MLTALLAQDPAAPQQPFFMNPLFMPAIVVLFIVIVMLPMGRRQKREQLALLTNLKRGTRVVTAAGIIGTVTAVKDGEDEITIRSEDARIKVLKSSVVKILGSDEAEAGK